MGDNDSMKQKIINTIKELVPVIFGSILFAASLNMFLIPAQVVQGGVTGIATALNIRFGVDVGLIILLLNIPLILANARVNGIRFIIKSAVGVALTSLFTDTLVHFPVTLTDPFLCALIGGAIMGCGCGIMFARGYTTGGTDLAVFLLKKKWNRLSTGKMILLCDAFIIVGAALLLEDYLGVFYSTLAVYTQSTVVDMFLTGADRTRLFLIVTERTNDVAAALAGIERGVTVLHGYGFHTERKKSVLLCAVKPRQVYSAKNAVLTADPAAFTVIADCSQTYGEGFKENDKI